MSGAAERRFSIPAAAASDPAALAKSMKGLAGELLPVYGDPDPGEFRDMLFRLQTVDGREADALATLSEIAAAPPPSRATRWLVRDRQYLILARARARAAADGLPFPEAFAREFRSVVGALDDESAAVVLQAFGIGEPLVRRDLDAALEPAKAGRPMSLPEALALVRAYQIDESYRAFSPLVAPLVAEDDRRRYVIEDDDRVPTADGATICARVMRPRSATGRLPALLQFTIYADATSLLRDERRTAAHGYASVLGFTRGKACSPDKPVPYEHDGADATAVLDWIARQPWSDGRVGMYGGSYSGFTPWAAAAHLPKALKAIMVGAPAAPGFDVPMEGNIFWNFVYPWPFYTTDNRTLDEAIYGDTARWRRLDREWYASGRAYRDLDKIDGTPNPIFDRWLDHPTIDAYWQAMAPDAKALARIDMPILMTAGYYFGGPGGAVHYLSEHLRANPKAPDRLLIGPYDHFQAQRGTGNLLGPDDRVISGETRDPAASIDMIVLRYAWFDHVFRAAPLPGILSDRINYEVTGADVWKHAPSIDAMGPRRRRFRLTAVRSGGAFRLSEGGSPAGGAIPLAVDLADRTDVDRPVRGGGVRDTAVDSHCGLVFESEPFPEPTELSGLFSGHLAFAANKKDFDFEIDLYEKTSAGSYVQLAPYWARASAVGDLTRRRLLTPGRRETLDFRSVRLMSRRLGAGSRLVAVLRIVKETGRQIDYGTGKDVSDETIADAGEPLRIRWFDDSFIEVPQAR